MYFSFGLQLQLQLDKFGEAEVYIRLFPCWHKNLFFSIIIQGSLFINIFYKTNINFTSPAAAPGPWLDEIENV